MCKAEIEKVDGGYVVTFYNENGKTRKVTKPDVDDALRYVKDAFIYDWSGASRGLCFGR